MRRNDGGSRGVGGALKIVERKRLYLRSPAFDFWRGAKYIESVLLAASGISLEPEQGWMLP